MSKTPFYVSVFAAALFISSSAQAGSSALSVAPTPSAQAILVNPSPISGVQDPQRVSLAAVEGEVSYQKAGGSVFSRASSGMTLETGTTIKTGEGSCEIVFDDQSRISIAPGTQLTLSEALKNLAANTRSTLLKLDLGKLKAKITKVTPGSRFEITTPSAVAAVRGTTLILESLLLSGKYIANLYVDESSSGVLFTNTESGDSEFVPAYSDSTSGDGDVADPQETTEEEKGEFNEGFDENTDGDTGDLPEDPTDPNATGGETDDAETDKTSEQNTSGGAAQDAAEEAADDQSGTAQDEAERLLISQEIARLTGDLDFNHADANLAQVSDAQTGKVMTDVHGNRVRVDQYVFKESQSKGRDIVRFLSLTARTGEYQNGVTSVLFGAAFNASIAVPLRDLPWDEYLNAVKDNDLSPNYGSGYEGPYFDEFIVHESADASAASGPSLYPTSFFVWFANPVRAGGARDTVGFEEFYSDPLKVGSDSQDRDFWVQGRTGELTVIEPFGGDQIVAGYDIFEGSFLRINGVSQDITYSGGGDDNGDGSQTESFASLYNSNNIDLMAPNSVEYYRSLPINSNGDSSDDDHPAYFHDKFGDGPTPYSLIGVFIPINDAGQIYDAPGFRVNSLRGLVSPNTQVNGGNYNLETIFFFGTQNVETDEFQEIFRIDAIITPEILSDMGTVNQSEYFPSQLYPDNDDYYYGE